MSMQGRQVVAKSVNDVVLMVIQQAKQVNTKFTINTAIHKQAVALVMDKLNQLDNFYTEIHTSYLMYGDMVTKIEFTFSYIDAYAVIQVCKKQASVNKLTPKQKQEYTKCKSIIAQIIKPNMTPYQKEYVINSYIVKTCVYDKEAFNCPNQKDPRYIDAYTPYGVLFKGKAVCDGIAQTASILFTLAGMDSYILRSETHAWNLVKVGDSFYHLDVTWNRTTDTNEFFNLTDAQISRYDKHNWRNKVLFPKANSTQFNYFVVNKLVVRNMNELKQQIQRDMDAKKPTNVWVSGFTVTADDLAKIMSELNRSGYRVGSFSFKLPNLSPQDFSMTLTVTY